jgi:hypothetical protein
MFDAQFSILVLVLYTQTVMFGTSLDITWIGHDAMRPVDVFARFLPNG